VTVVSGVATVAVVPVGMATVAVVTGVLTVTVAASAVVADEIGSVGRETLGTPSMEVDVAGAPAGDERVPAGDVPAAVGDVPATAVDERTDSG
jgi:hypothetical protein